MPYDVNAGKDLVSVDEILARYLWNQETAPSNSELINDKWIRDADALGDALILDTQEYMTHGAGRFVSAANFEFFKDFFKADNLSAGTYNFSAMWKSLRPGITERPQDKFDTDVYQYLTGIGSSDYITRAFIFGSTSFTADLASLVFVVHADGSREIQGLKIIPSKNPAKEENFDFKGGDWVIDQFNKYFNDIIDPSRIGRKIPIHFSGDVPAVTVTDKEFAQLLKTKEDLAQQDFNQYSDSDPASFPMIYHLSEIKKRIKESPSINYTDSHGRKVIYDGKDRFHDGSLEAEL